ncbi:hypothetical protein P7C70_g3878, partial [Phenoliferia sp. Uapishka_3]
MALDGSPMTPSKRRYSEVHSDTDATLPPPSLETPPPSYKSENQKLSEAGIMEYLDAKHPTETDSSILQQISQGYTDLVLAVARGDSSKVRHQVVKICTRGRWLAQRMDVARERQAVEELSSESEPDTDLEEDPPLSSVKSWIEKRLLECEEKIVAREAKAARILAGKILRREA